MVIAFFCKLPVHFAAAGLLAFRNRAFRRWAAPGSRVLIVVLSHFWWMAYNLQVAASLKFEIYFRLEIRTLGVQCS